MDGSNELALAAKSLSAASAAPTTATKHAVIVASDVRLYGEGLSLVFAADGRLRLSKAADTADATIAAIDDGDVHALLLDAALPEVRRVLRAVRERAPRLPIVMFGVPEHDEELLYCVEAGATAFVSRDVGSRELIETVLSALRGEAILSSRSAAQVLGRLVHRVRIAAQFTPDTELTPREQQIASLLNEGLSNKEIAQRLRICVATVKNHVHRILAKLHVRRRGQAASRMRTLLNQKV